LLSGNRGGLTIALQRILASKAPIYQLLNAVLRQFQQLDVLRCEMERTGVSSSQAVNEFGKAIFFKRKPIVTRALEVWNRNKLSREVSRLQSTVLQSQKNPLIAESIATQLLLSLTIQSASQR
jgi:DNA polymerase III subunit delta